LSLEVTFGLALITLFIISAIFLGSGGTSFIALSGLSSGLSLFFFLSESLFFS
jgi:hypothetical protein